MAATDLRLFRDEQTHPLILLRTCLKLFGPEVLEWEPVVIRRAIEDRAESNISRVNFVKVLAALTVANRDNFWLEWETFHFISQALNNNIPSAGAMQDQSIGQLMVAVDIANSIRAELGPLSEVPEFSDEVKRYIAAQLSESGIWFAPEPLTFVNPLIAGVTQICDECGNEEEPQPDGLCSFCTARYDTDSLLKMEPDEELRKRYDGSRVRVVEKFKTLPVQKRLMDYLTKPTTVLRETQADICTAKIVTGLEYMMRRRSQLKKQEAA
jgi:hypothetical protein